MPGARPLAHFVQVGKGSQEVDHQGIMEQTVHENSPPLHHKRLLRFELHKETDVQIDQDIQGKNKACAEVVLQSVVACTSLCM